MESNKIKDDPFQKAFLPTTGIYLIRGFIFLIFLYYLFATPVGDNQFWAYLTLLAIYSLHISLFMHCQWESDKGHFCGVHGYFVCLNIMKSSQEARELDISRMESRETFFKEHSTTTGEVTFASYYRALKALQGDLNISEPLYIIESTYFHLDSFNRESIVCYLNKQEQPIQQSIDLMNTYSDITLIPNEAEFLRIRESIETFAFKLANCFEKMVLLRIHYYYNDLSVIQKKFDPNHSEEYTMFYFSQQERNENSLTGKELLASFTNIIEDFYSPNSNSSDIEKVNILVKGSGESITALEDFFLNNRDYFNLLFKNYEIYKYFRFVGYSEEDVIFETYNHSNIPLRLQECLTSILDRLNVEFGEEEIINGHTNYYSKV